MIILAGLTSGVNIGIGAKKRIFYIFLEKVEPNLINMVGNSQLMLQQGKGEITVPCRYTDCKREGAAK
jgi:hypothetical protein